jgi:hypothetical protein
MITTQAQRLYCDVCLRDSGLVKSGKVPVAQRVRRGINNDATSGEANNPAGEGAGVAHLMEAADHSHALRAYDVPQELQHTSCRDGVQAGDRLVRNDETRLLSERTGDCDPLLLAARQTVRPGMGLLEHANPFQAFERLELVGSLKAAKDSAPKGGMAQPSAQHIFERSQPPHEIIVLKNDSDLTPACQGRVGDVGVAKPNPAGIGFE